MSLCIETSLNESPPDYSKYEGVRFVKRIIVNRDTVRKDMSLQARNNIYDDENIANIRNSKREHGELYNEPVKVVCASETQLDWDLLSGYNRDAAENDLEQEGLEQYKQGIYDVVEFDTPLDKEAFVYEVNHIKAPRRGNADGDLIKGISKVVKLGYINNKDDNAIKAYIARIAADKTQTYRNKLFKDYRKHNGKFEHMRPLDNTLAKNLAKELGIPYSGDGNKDVDILGYIKNKGGGKNIFYDAVVLNLKFDAPVYVYGWIDNPTPSTLKGQRAAWKNQFDKDEELYYNFLAQKSGEDIAKLREKNSYFIRFGGFLPQDITPDPNKGGLPREEGIVDENGKPFSAKIIPLVKRSA